MYIELQTGSGELRAIVEDFDNYHVLIVIKLYIQELNARRVSYLLTNIAIPVKGPSTTCYPLSQSHRRTLLHLPMNIACRHIPYRTLSSDQHQQG